MSFKIVRIRKWQVIVLSLSGLVLSVLFTNCSGGSKFLSETNSRAPANFFNAATSSANNATASSNSTTSQVANNTSGNTSNSSASSNTSNTSTSSNTSNTSTSSNTSNTSSQETTAVQTVAPAIRTLPFDDVMNAGLNGSYPFASDGPLIKSNILIMSGLPSAGARVAFMDFSQAERTVTSTQCDYYSSTRFVNGIPNDVIHNGDTLYLYCLKSLYFNTVFSAAIMLSDIQTGAIIAQKTWSATTMSDPGTWISLQDFGYGDARQSSNQPVFSATRVVAGLGDGVRVPIVTSGNDGGLSYSVNGTWYTGYASVQNGDVIQMQYRKPASFTYTSKTVSIHYEQVGYAVPKVEEIKWRLTF